MSSFLRGPSLGRELVKMRSLEGDGDRSEGTLTGSGQATLSALLHAGSETAEIKGFAVSTAFPLSKYKQPQPHPAEAITAVESITSCRPWLAEFLWGRKDCPAMNKTRGVSPKMEFSVLGRGDQRPVFRVSERAWRTQKKPQCPDAHVCAFCWSRKVLTRLQIVAPLYQGRLEF